MSYNYISTSQSSDNTRYAKILDFIKPSVEISRNSQFIIDLMETGIYQGNNTKIQISTVYNSNSNSPRLDIVSLGDNKNNLIMVEESDVYSLYARTNYTGNSIIVNVDLCENIAFLKGYNSATFDVNISDLTYQTIKPLYEYFGKNIGDSYYRFCNIEFTSSIWETPIVASFELTIGTTGGSEQYKYNKKCQFVIRAEIDYTGTCISFVPEITGGTLAPEVEIHSIVQSYNFVTAHIRLPRNLYYKLKRTDIFSLYPERTNVSFSFTKIDSLPSGVDSSVVGK